MASPPSVRQSPSSSAATATVLVNTTPARAIRSHAASAASVPHVPEASVTAHAPYPAATADWATKDTQTSVLMPERIS